MEGLKLSANTMKGKIKMSKETKKQKKIKELLEGYEQPVSGSDEIGRASCRERV